MADDTTTDESRPDAPGSETDRDDTPPGLDAPESETDQDASPPDLVAEPSEEPASGASREDMPTSGELDAGPLDAVTQEAAEGRRDDVEDMAVDPGADVEPVAGEDDPELAGIEEPALSAGATADAEAHATDALQDAPDEDAAPAGGAPTAPELAAEEAAQEARTDGAHVDAAQDQDDLDDLLGMAGADADERESAMPEPGDEIPAEHPEPDSEASEVEEASATPEQDAPEPEVTRPRRPRSTDDVRDKKDLMRLPGQWFVVHTYSGYEQRVKDNLLSRVESLGADDQVYEVVIPTNEVTEFKKGKKQTVQKKFLPGYVLVRMEMEDELWGLVRHTPAVTGFVGGPGNRPVPLSIREVAETLKIPDEVVEEAEVTEEETAAEQKKAAAADIDLDVGETVRVTTGPFADFTGTIAEINVDQAKLRVMVSVFGRETPIELPFDNVAKL